MPNWEEHWNNMRYGDGAFYQPNRAQQQARIDGHVNRRDPQRESGGFREKTKAQRQSEMDNDVSIVNKKEMLK